MSVKVFDVSGDSTTYDASDVQIIVADLIEHETAGDGCPCGPIVEAVFRDDGSNGWQVIHHSLDGRERFETHALDDVAREFGVDLGEQG